MRPSGSCAIARVRGRPVPRRGEADEVAEEGGYGASLFRAMGVTRSTSSRRSRPLVHPPLPPEGRSLRCCSGRHKGHLVGLTKTERTARRISGAKGVQARYIAHGPNLGARPLHLGLRVGSGGRLEEYEGRQIADHCRSMRVSQAGTATFASPRCHSISARSRSTTSKPAAAVKVSWISTSLIRRGPRSPGTSSEKHSQVHVAGHEHIGEHLAPSESLSVVERVEEAHIDDSPEGSTDQGRRLREDVCENEPGSLP